MPPRDSTVTKSKILDAAFKQFTVKGFAGARVDDIAHEAGVNKALLYQYYGDKDALYRNVLECKMSQINEVVGLTDPMEVVSRIFDFHAANPWLARLTQWEALSTDGKALCDEKARRERLAEHVAAIKKAQDEGTIDPDLDPEQTLITLMALITYSFSAPQVTRMVTGKEPYSKQELQKRKKHVMYAAEKLLRRK